MNYFFYSLDTQFANTGDLLINKSLIDIIANKGIVYLEDKAKPEDFVDLLIVKNVVRLSSVSDKTAVEYLQQKLSEKNDNDNDNYFLVLVPGDLSRVHLRRALANILALKKYYKIKSKGGKILRLGISLGKLEKLNGFAEFLNSFFYHAYAVRDMGSLAKAKKYRFFNLSYFPDLAWGYNWINKPHTALKKKEYVILSFRSNTYGTLHGTEYLSPIIMGLKELLKQSNLASLKIFISYQVEYDKEASHEIYESLSKDFDVELMDRNLGLEEACTFYFDAKCIISNRLHVLLLGIIADTLVIPYVNILDNKKITGIFKDNGLSESIIDQNDDININIDKINDILKNHDYWIQKYASAKTDNIKLLSSSINQILLK